MQTRIKKVKEEKEIARFRNFWDEQKEHEDDPEEMRNNFFDVPSYVVYTEEDNKLIGMLFIYIRDIKYADTDLKFGGLGAVATHREHRREGVATKLLKKACEVMRKEGIDMSMLTTNIEKYGSLYGKVGFVPLERQYYFEDRNGKIVADDGGMITSVRSPDLVDDIVNSSEKLFIGKSNF